VCVTVVSVSQHETRMLLTVLSSVARLAVPYFFHIISQMGRYSENGYWTFLFLYNFCLKHFSFEEELERYYHKYIYIL